MERHALSLCAAANAIRAGELTSEAYTQALLDRIAATDRDIEAWAHVDPASALESARACDAGRKSGPLAGIGVGVKDIVATRGSPTQFGSPIPSSALRAGYARASSLDDAECIARLGRAGGFVLGKTVTTEFSFLHPGKTKNPWSSTHTPGGSSSGSAAAVAIGQVAAAIGEQTNGSIIRPAAFCGVVGFKPTRAAISYEGVGAFSPTLDTLGVFARSVVDCARLASALADEGRIADAPKTIDRPHLALLAGFPWTALDAQQQHALDAASEKLKAAGALVTPVELPAGWREAHLTLRTIMLYEAVEQLGELQSRERARMSAKLNGALDEGRALDGRAYRGALSRRDTMIVEATEWLAPFDAVLCPPARGVAPKDLTQTGDPACCTLWSLLGFPAMTIPIALAGGLPLGMQLAAAAGGDDGLVSVAHWCEARLPFKGLLAA